jgi:hypothetical protein
MPPVLPPVSGPRAVEVGPHTTVGFPRTDMLDGKPLHFSPVMSFSGEGHQIWQDAEVDPRLGNNPGFRASAYASVSFATAWERISGRARRAWPAHIPHFWATGIWILWLAVLRAGTWIWLRLIVVAELRSVLGMGIRLRRTVLLRLWLRWLRLWLRHRVWRGRSLHSGRCGGTAGKSGWTADV